MQTITPLSKALALEIDAQFSKDLEKELARAAIASPEVVLVAWQHERIPDIAKHILSVDGDYPARWLKTRFDRVWAFDRAEGTETWTLTQVPQMLLPGDSPDPIPVD